MTGQQPSVLAAHPFLRGLSRDQVGRLAVAARHVAMPARQRLFEEGAPADRFWLIDAGSVVLDTVVPGHGRVIIETLGRGDPLGLSWLLPPYEWEFGAMTTQATQAFEFDAAEVRAACQLDCELGSALYRRLLQAAVCRLQATRNRLVEVSAHPDLLP